MCICGLNLNGHRTTLCPPWKMDHAGTPSTDPHRFTSFNWDSSKRVVSTPNDIRASPDPHRVICVYFLRNGQLYGNWVAITSSSPLTLIDAGEQELAQYTLIMNQSHLITNSVSLGSTSLYHFAIINFLSLSQQTDTEIHLLESKKSGT